MSELTPEIVPTVAPPPPSSNTTRSLILGGILPIVFYTVVESYFGTEWGLVAGLLVGGWEVVSEWRKLGRVETLTWIGNGLLLVMGALSFFTSSGVWFKLQPAIMELFMAGFLIGSVIVGKPFMTMMFEKQGMGNKFAPEGQLVMKEWMKHLTWRLGIFFLLHAILATYAAFYWSTTAWAILKGVGFTVSMVVYMFAEVLVMRIRTRPRP